MLFKYYIPDSGHKKPRVAVLNKRLLQDLLNYTYKLGENFSFVNYFSFYDRATFNRYRIDSPAFLHVWNTPLTFMMKLMHGIGLNYNILRLTLKRVHLDKAFSLQKQVLSKPVTHFDDNLSYFDELMALKLSFPETFLLPHEFKEEEPSVLYDTYDAKKRRRKPKYRSTKHYKNWLLYSERYVQLLHKFLPLYDGSLLKDKKALFESISSFDSKTYIPRTKMEAFYLYSLYGPPPKDCKDSVRAMLFISIFLSGYYIRPNAPCSFSRFLAYRRIIMNSALDNALILNKEAASIKFIRNPNDVLIINTVKKVYFYITYFLTTRLSRIRNFFLLRKERAKDFSILMRNRYDFYTNFYSSLVLGTMLREASLIFHNNPSSFLWYMSPTNFKTFVMTVYMCGIEILHDNRNEKYWDPQWTDTSDTFTEVWMHKLLDSARFFLYDCIIYPISLIFRPWCEILFVIPFFFIVDRTVRLFLSINTIKNNVWYATLYSYHVDHALRQVGGNKGFPFRAFSFMVLLFVRLMRIFLVAAKALVKTGSFFLFCWFFLFCLQYSFFIELFKLNDWLYTPLSFDRGEWFILYVCLVLYAGLIIFGSYSLKEFLWIELGPAQALAHMVTMMLWSWRTDASLGVSSYYPTSWSDFTFLENPGEFTHDKQTVSPARYDFHGTYDSAPSKKYYHRSYNWRADHFTVALGEETAAVDKFRLTNE